MLESMAFIKSLKLRIAAGLILLVLFAFSFQNCASPTSNSTSTNPPAPKAQIGCFEQLGINTEWSNEVEVPIDAYGGSAMEPKISADQMVLFFNNKTASDTEMDVHYAVKQPSGRFQYAGTLPGTVVPNVLDGVPSMDAAGNFYFTSMRNYGAAFRTIYSGQLTLNAGGLSVVNVAPADNALGQGQMWWFDMDADVSWDGQFAVISRADFSSQLAYPDSSHLVFVSVQARQLQPVANGVEILKNVNLSDCRVYAPSLSNDLKELYYTVLAKKANGEFDFRVVVSKRANTTDSFSVGSVISAIPGGVVAEAPSITFDDGGKTLYFHKKDLAADKFKIYKVTRP